MISRKMGIVLDVPSLRRNSDTLCIMCANVCVCMCVCVYCVCVSVCACMCVGVRGRGGRGKWLAGYLSILLKLTGISCPNVLSVNLSLLLHVCGVKAGY